MKQVLIYEAPTGGVIQMLDGSIQRLVFGVSDVLIIVHGISHIKTLLSWRDRTRIWEKIITEEGAHCYIIDQGDFEAQIYAERIEVFKGMH